MEMEMCTEEDIIIARTQSQSSHGRRESRVSKDVTVIEPAQTRRDLFEEDQDNDIREREADKKDLNKSKDSRKSENDDSSDDVVFVEKDSKSDNGGKVLNGSIRKVNSSEKSVTDVRMTKVGDVEEDEEYSTNLVNTNKPQDTRRCVVSKNANYEISDERVVEFSSRDSKKEKSHKDSKMNTDDDVQDDDGDDDGVNIYEDMPQDLDLFQPEEEI